jgi:hypothetical protein
VDKFQGQQAPVVFFSMASSGGEDAPRGDRLPHVAQPAQRLSRAQCLAYLVCSPALLDVDAKTIEHMRLANALCRYVELADQPYRCRGQAFETLRPLEGVLGASRGRTSSGRRMPIALCGLIRS